MSNLKTGTSNLNWNSNKRAKREKEGKEEKKKMR
jgi:hypothetical protein